MWRFLQFSGLSFCRCRASLSKVSDCVLVNVRLVAWTNRFVARKLHLGTSNVVGRELVMKSCSRACSSEALDTGKVKAEEVNSEAKEGAEPSAEEDVVNVTFVTHEGEEIKVKAKVGDNLLKLAMKHDVGCEGACGGELSCTTCHMYVDENYFDVVEGPSVREEDLLDIAKFLKPNSRLVCQINLTKEMNGLRLTLPPGTVNFYVDDYKPKPH